MFIKFFVPSAVGGFCLFTGVSAAMGQSATPVIVVACILGAVAWFAAPFVQRR